MLHMLSVSFSALISSPAFMGIPCGKSWNPGGVDKLHAMHGAVGIKGLDAFAIRMLTNVENQAEARLTSKKDNAILKASRAAARAALRAQEVRIS